MPSLGEGPWEGLAPSWAVSSSFLPLGRLMYRKPSSQRVQSFHRASKRNRDPGNTTDS